MFLGVSLAGRSFRCIFFGSCPILRKVALQGFHSPMDQNPNKRGKAMTQSFPDTYKVKKNLVGLEANLAGGRPKKDAAAIANAKSILQ